MNFLCYKKKATDKENQSLQGNSFIETRGLQKKLSNKTLEMIDDNSLLVLEKKASIKVSTFRNSQSTKSIDFQNLKENATNTSLSNAYKDMEGKSKDSKYMLKYQELIRNDSSLNKSQELDILRSSFSLIKGISAKSQLEDNYLNPIMELLSQKLRNQKQNHGILKNHSITDRVRSKMIDWMLEVLCTYKCRNETFYKAVSILDRFLLITQEKFKNEDIHLIGVACMFIACKYEEIYPIKLKIFYEKISHKRLPSDQILKTESKIMKTLNFDLGFTNIWEFCGALSALFKVGNFSKYVDKLNFIGRMLVHDSEFIYSNNIFEIALGMFHIAIGDQDFTEMSFYKEKNHISDFQISDMSRKILKFKSNWEKEFPNLKSLTKFSKW